MSGGASIRWVISIAPARSSIMPRPPRMRFRFGELAQPVQIARPHLSQDDLQRAERPPVRFVIAMGSLGALVDQPSSLVQPQVLGVGGRADVADGRGVVAGGALRTPDQPQDLAA